MPLFKKTDDINDINYTWWYWSSSPVNDPNTVTKPAALYTATGSPISGLPAKSDVIAPRSVTFALSQFLPNQTVSVVEDGGNLDFTITGVPVVPFLFFDFSKSKLSTLSVTGGPLIPNLISPPLAWPNTDVELSFTGFGAPGTQSFVLSDKAKDLSINDLRPIGETGTIIVGGTPSVVPYAPTATPDTVSVLEKGHSIAIQANALATDKNNGAVLTIDKIGTGAQGPQYGTVTVAPDGKSLLYTATTLDYEVGGILTGNQDAFQVSLKDSLGGEVTSFVTVSATPVAEPPTVTVAVKKHDGDPVNEVRLLVTVHSADFGTVNAGSDYLKSIALNLTGNFANATVSDTAGLLPNGPLSSNETINLSGKNDSFTDEIDLFLPTLPANTNLRDSLAVTATGAEIEGTGSPPTASATDNQSIAIDSVSSQTDRTFTTTDQSIWGPGTTALNSGTPKPGDTGFLGLDTTFHVGTTNGTVGFTASAKAHLRVGLQAGIAISAGDFSATLPFEVDLDNTYNSTTDTLQITATDKELGTGPNKTHPHFTAKSPYGNFTFGLVMGLQGSAVLTVGGDSILNRKLPLGSLTKPVYTWGVSGNQTIQFGGTGLVSSRFPVPQSAFQMNLGPFPQLTTKGSKSGTGTISGTGDSADFLQLKANMLTVLEGLFTNVVPFEHIQASAKVVSIDITTLTAILHFALSLQQHFDLSVSGLTPALFLEDGTIEPLKMDGSPLTISNASSHDKNGDGKIEYTLGLVPKDPTVTNETSFAANAHGQITALALKGTAVGIKFGPFTAYKQTNVPLFGTSIPIYSNKFALGGFGQQTVKQTVPL